MFVVLDWYSFKKPSVTGQKMLDEVDEDFELKQIADKKKMSRYRRIAEALETHNGASSSARAGTGADSTSEDRSLPAVFGRAVNRALLKGTLGKGLVRKHLNDAGVDVDAGNQYQDFVGGDYTKVYADDEEEFVVNEQVVSLILT